MTHSISAVAFDLDGLMINSEELYRETGRQMLASRGKTAEEDLFQSMMGRTNDEALQIMIDWHDLDDTVDQLYEETRRLMNALIETRLTTMPGLLELLDHIEQLDMPKAVVTSATLSYLEKVLDKLGLRQRFEFLLTAEAVQRGKPDPEVYLLAAEKFGIEPRQMLVLEDSVLGCTAGVAAGATTVAVSSEFTGDMTEVDVHFLATSLADPRIRELLA